MSVIYGPPIWETPGSSIPRGPPSWFCFTPTHAPIFVISVPYGQPIQCHWPNSFSTSLPMTCTFILLPTHFLPSPTLVLQSFGIIPPLVTFSPTSTSILLFSLPGRLFLDLAELSNPWGPPLDSKAHFDLHLLNFSIPCKPILQAGPQSILTVYSAPTRRLQSTAGKITQLLRLMALTHSQFPKSPDCQVIYLSSNPFTRLEVVPSSISHTGYLWPSSHALTPFPVSFLSVTFCSSFSSL